jgi:hypothetical protein
MVWNVAMVERWNIGSKDMISLFATQRDGAIQFLDSYHVNPLFHYSTLPIASPVSWILAPDSFIFPLPFEP